MEGFSDAGSFSSREQTTRVFESYPSLSHIFILKDADVLSLLRLNNLYTVYKSLTVWFSVND